MTLRYSIIASTCFCLYLPLVDQQPANASSLFTNYYDSQIRSAAKTYLPLVPWQLLKAQLWQESKLNPNARSSVGAVGIAEFMPKTWIEVSSHLNMSGIPSTAAGPAIEGAAYYMGTMRKHWSFLFDWEQHRFAAASYNAGAGNIDAATEIPPCKGKFTWAEASQCLSKKTGPANAAQTIDYVDKIWHWWNEMQAGF